MGRSVGFLSSAFNSCRQPAIYPTPEAKFRSMISIVSLEDESRPMVGMTKTGLGP